MKPLVIFALIVLILPIVGSAKSFGDTNSTSSSMPSVPIVPPLKQIKIGIAPQNVECAKDLYLLIKSEDNSPACVSQTSVSRMVHQGWASVSVSISPLTIKTEKTQFKVNETVSFQIINNGTVPLGPVGWGYAIYGPDWQKVAPNRVLNMLLILLVPNGTMPWTWDQKDTNGTQVNVGNYTIIAYYHDTSGKEYSALHSIMITN